jgi:sulfur relay (sulfurtransferase) complex TusBCD TusD component (DsrE family)
MNNGVKLALPGPAADTLREMTDSGVELLVCGTCAKHFGITDEIAVGKISNMFEITEAVYGASKPITVG